MSMFGESVSDDDLKDAIAFTSTINDFIEKSEAVLNSPYCTKEQAIETGKDLIELFSKIFGASSMVAEMELITRDPNNADTRP